MEGENSDKKIKISNFLKNPFSLIAMNKKIEIPEIKETKPYNSNIDLDDLVDFINNDKKTDNKKTKNKKIKINEIKNNEISNNNETITTNANEFTIKPEEVKYSIDISQTDLENSENYLSSIVQKTEPNISLNFGNLSDIKKIELSSNINIIEEEDKRDNYPKNEQSNSHIQLNLEDIKNEIQTENFEIQS